MEAQTADTIVTADWTIDDLRNMLDVASEDAIPETARVLIFTRTDTSEHVIYTLKELREMFSPKIVQPKLQPSITIEGWSRNGEEGYAHLTSCGQSIEIKGGAELVDVIMALVRAHTKTIMI